MKLQLDENTLNAYINEAIRQELSENVTDELFGSRVRKQSRRMITGQGWGNQKRSENGFMAANSDISATDADEVVPQTLVGMIKKMEQGLVSIEQTAGLPGNYESLGEKVAAYRSGGGFKMKQSLLNAINALSRLADRLSAVEKISGSNAIMESNASRNGDYVDATMAGNAAVGNAGNMRQLGGLQKAAKSASAAQSSAHKAFNTAQHNMLNALGDPNLTQAKVNNLNKAYNNASTTLKNAEKATRAADGELTANGIRRSTGFWGKQLANVKNGAQGVKDGFQTIKGAKNTGNAVQAGVAAYHQATGAGKTAAQASKAAKSAIRGTKTAGQIAKGAGQIAKGIGQISQIPMLLLSIADEAARQGAEARQRKIVRTYNCASVLAKRMANIAKEIQNANGGEEVPADTLDEMRTRINEINVNKSRQFFDSIERGMTELSGLMKQINASLNNGQNQPSSGVQMPSSLNTPQEIKQFQEWANANGYKDDRGMELVPDGKWGPRTEYVYNQMSGGALEEGRKTMNESNAVMRALTDLENKVGSTGAGGRAYSDISAMSGAKDGSRSQGARGAKFIIRTYPPVLNQYLQVLSVAGANVNGIQPLQVDNRPHRDYDWQEIQAINERIQQLLSIARDFTPKKGGNVPLPPKPVRPAPNPNPNPTPRDKENATPEIEMPEINTDVEIENPEIDVNLDDVFANLDSSIPNIELIVNPYTLESYGIIPNDKSGRITKRELKQKIKDAVERGILTPESANELIKKLKQDYRNGVSQTLTNPDGSVVPTTDNARRSMERQRRKETRETNKANRENMRAANRTADTLMAESRKTTKNISEQTFKKLVKQLIAEEYMKRKK